MPELSVTVYANYVECVLPTGEAVSVSHRVPLYTLAHKLEALG